VFLEHLYEYVWIEGASKVNFGLQHCYTFGVTHGKGIVGCRSIHMAQPILSVTGQNGTISEVEMK